MNNDLNKMNNILGILNVKYNSCKNDTAPTSFTLPLCLISSFCNLKIHSQIISPMLSPWKQSYINYTTHKQQTICCTVKSYYWFGRSSNQHSKALVWTVISIIQSCVALRRGCVLRNGSLGDFIIVRTSQSVLTQT